jgi:hypothetical protein
MKTPVVYLLLCCAVLMLGGCASSQVDPATSCSTWCAGKGDLVVAERQHRAVGTVLEAVMQAVFT